jgi:hypothetical protein
MIDNDEELAMARSRLALIEAELALLRRDMLRQDRRTHDLMCEYFIRRIDQLKAEIAAYQTAAKPDGVNSGPDTTAHAQAFERFAD